MKVAAGIAKINKQTSAKRRRPRYLFFVGKEKEFVIENLGMLLGSGLNISSALLGLQDEIKSRSLKKLLQGIKDDIDNGSTLWRALEFSGLFNEHTISLIRVGEESGRLAENLKLVAVQEAKEKNFKSKIKGALMYPIFVLILALIIGVGVAWFILPKLVSVFDQLKMELPIFTRWLIIIGKFLGDYGNTVVPLCLVVFSLLIYFLFYFKPTKFIGQSIFFFIPFSGRLLQQIELTRFSYLLGTLLEAGLPVTQALESITRSSTMPRYAKFYKYLENSIQEGNSFQKSFLNFRRIKKYIPASMQQLVISGEQSGNLSEVLLRVNVNYEAKIDNTTKNLTVILEPVLLVIVWVGVVMVALAVILPIYNLVGGFNQNLDTPLIQNNNVQEQVIKVVPEEQVVIKEEKKLYLKIFSPVTGFLNVRAGANLDGRLLGRVNNADIYQYTNEQDGWYRIILCEELLICDFKANEGWVFGQYVTIVNDNE